METNKLPRADDGREESSFLFLLFQPIVLTCHICNINFSFYEWRQRVSECIGFGTIIPALCMDPVAWQNDTRLVLYTQGRCHFFPKRQEAGVILPYTQGGCHLAIYTRRVPSCQATRWVLFCQASRGRCHKFLPSDRINTRGKCPCLVY